MQREERRNSNAIVLVTFALCCVSPVPLGGAFLISAVTALAMLRANGWIRIVVLVGSVVGVAAMVSTSVGS